MENTSQQEISSAVKARPNHLPWILGGLGLGILLLCGLSVVAGFLLSYFSGTPLHGTQVTFQAQPVGGKQPSTEDMQQAANILKARAKLYGMKSYSFKVSGADQITARLPRDEKLEETVKSFAQIGLVEFVDVGDECVADGARVVTDYSPSVQNTPADKINHTLITGEKIQSVSVSTDAQDRYLLNLEFNEDGKDIFYEFTKNHVGQCLAITLDQTVITDPKINSPIPDGRAIIEGNFTAESANHLAALIKTTPLPFALNVIGMKDY